MPDKNYGGKGNVEHSVKASTPASLRVLRLPQVCRVTGLCRSMIYQLEADRRFPRRIKIGVRAVGWLEDEVQAWLSRKIAASRPPADASTSTAEP